MPELLELTPAEPHHRRGVRFVTREVRHRRDVVVIDEQRLAPRRDPIADRRSDRRVVEQPRLLARTRSPRNDRNGRRACGPPLSPPARRCRNGTPRLRSVSCMRQAMRSDRVPRGERRNELVDRRHGRPAITVELRRRRKRRRPRARAPRRGRNRARRGLRPTSRRAAAGRATDRPPLRSRHRPTRRGRGCTRRPGPRHALRAPSCSARSSSSPVVRRSVHARSTIRSERAVRDDVEMARPRRRRGSRGRLPIAASASCGSRLDAVRVDTRAAEERSRARRRHTRLRRRDRRRLARLRPRPRATRRRRARVRRAAPAARDAFGAAAGALEPRRRARPSRRERVRDRRAEGRHLLRRARRGTSR